MTSSRISTFAMSAILLASGLAPLARAQAADDTARNRNQTVTADKQSNAKADRLLTAKVRKAIIADKDLSMYAHNVKIVTVNGVVTLKGPVKSEEEKQKVAADAASAASADAVKNELTVKN